MPVGTRFESSDRTWTRRYPAGVPSQLNYPAESIPWLLEESARRNPTRIAVRYFHQEMTYDQLLGQSRRMAAAFRARGVRPGDRIGILLPNVPEYLTALFGAWMAGTITVPISPFLVPGEVSALLRSTECRVVVCLDLLLPLIWSERESRPEVVLSVSIRDRLPWWDRQKYRIARLHRLGFRFPLGDESIEWFEAALSAALPDPGLERPGHSDAAHILPTGGTTGRAKPVLLTHHNLLANAWQLFHWIGRRTDEDVVLACLPFFHCYGLTVCGLTGVAMGATLVLHHRFRADTVLGLIEKWRPTIIPAVPAMLAAFNTVLRRRNYDLGHVRAVISGGAALDPGIAAEFAEKSGAVVVEGYGLSEASPVTHTGPLDGSARPGTIGFPLPDTDALIVDPLTGTEILPAGAVGELIVRGPQVMAGYWKDQETTAVAIRDGWLFTGDLASRDDDGFFRIVDRKKDVIITSGFNVYPTDVETVLRQFDGIEDVAIFGIPDTQRGEIVKAVVVPRSGRRFDRHKFDVFVREHLDVHKRPRAVEVVRGPLPRNPLGKVLRRELRGKVTPTPEGLTLQAPEPAANPR